MYIGIYGFEFNKSIKIESAELELIPIGKTDKDAKSLAKDKRNFNLTGFIEVAEKRSRGNEEKIWIVSSLLTFCQQQCVIVSYSPVKEMQELPLKLNGLTYRYSQTDLLYFDSSKEKLLNILYSKLKDDEFIAKTDFKTAFYRNVELWRLNRHFIDITYYFCFSGIEALARCSKGDYETKNVAEVITPFLRDLGFNVTQNEMQNFARVRNALFHYGAKSKGELKLGDFEDEIMRLFPDVLLKVVGFEDGYINWNRWKDLMG